MLNGPFCHKAYCRAIAALCHQDWYSVFSVRAPCTRHAVRNWRWSCRLAPTPGRSRCTAMPSSRRSSPGPMPERSSNAGAGVFQRRAGCAPLAMRRGWIGPSRHRVGHRFARRRNDRRRRCVIQIYAGLVGHNFHDSCENRHCFYIALRNPAKPEPSGKARHPSKNRTIICLLLLFPVPKAASKPVFLHHRARVHRLQ